MDFTLAYLVPRNRQNLSRQLAQVAAVVLDEGEGVLLDCAFVDAGTTNVGANVQRLVTAVPGPTFTQRFPTLATQIAALTNLFTGRFSTLCAAPCTALTPF
jgi:hypothetical protein